MTALPEHQKRVSTLRDGLNRLLALHQRVHDLHNESLALARTRPADYEGQIRALKDQARGVHDEIELLRESLDLEAAGGQ